MNRVFNCWNPASYVLSFVEFSGRVDEECRVDFSAFMSNLPQLSTREVEYCKGTIMAVDIRDTVAECSKKLSRLRWSTLRAVQLYGRLVWRYLCSSVLQREHPWFYEPRIGKVAKELLKEGDVIGNATPIHLINIDLNILANLLEKWSAHVINKLINKTQMCAVPGRSIHDNFYLECNGT